MSDAAAPRATRPWLRWAALLYGLVLLFSHGVWWAGDEEAALSPAEVSIELPRIDGPEQSGRPVRLVLRDLHESAPDSRPVVVLVHGSPGSLQDFDALGDTLSRHFRVLVPDLPGFGKSERSIPDYSARAHAGYLIALFDRLGIDEAHLVAFSMGGAVCLELWDQDPERVASLTMAGAIGVEELELFGNHELNHAVHGAQVALVQGVAWLTPHFGAIDDFALGLPYARNFYDTDQRTLRGLLERVDVPFQVIHGERDFLVPVEVAREHHRIVPHSELTVFDDGHFLLWTRPADVAERITAFVNAAEAGTAARRSDATPDRKAAAAAPYDPATAPPFAGPAFLVMMLLLIVATFVSEDLTCIGAGLLVAQGRIGLAAGMLACFLGLWIGDLLLYAAGRWLGRAVFLRAPLRWFVKRESLDRAARWFEARGGRVIILARVIPGLRLPTYVAAGVLRANLAACAFWFAVACVVWVPVLVGAAALLGSQAVDLLRDHGATAFLSLAAALLLSEKVLFRLVTRRRRQRLAGSWRRWAHFEFWPWWLVYVPVYGLVAWLAVKHGSLTLVTCANPAIPTGGIAGESKDAILRGLAGSAHAVAASRLLAAGPAPTARADAVRHFLIDTGLDFPVVLKPDVGERGEGVEIVPDEEACESYFRRHEGDTLVQEFVPGPEFGICYFRRPGETRGRIYSITRKVLATVTGDGTRPLMDLILDDRRAVCMASRYLVNNEERLGWVPEAGETVSIAQLGNHRLGCLFLDGNDLVTPALEEAIDRIAQGYEGFHIGRFDVRADSVAALQRGEGFKIVELNGLTSEPAHIYDPEGTVREAYRALFHHWRTAFEIARANRENGARPSTLFTVLRSF